MKSKQELNSKLMESKRGEQSSNTMELVMQIVLLDDVILILGQNKLSKMAPDSQANILPAYGKSLPDHVIEEL